MEREAAQVPVILRAGDRGEARVPWAGATVISLSDSFFPLLGNSRQIMQTRLRWSAMRLCVFIGEGAITLSARRLFLAFTLPCSTFTFPNGRLARLT